MLNGPTFLQLDQNEWPTMPEIMPLSKNDVEVRAMHVNTKVKNDTLIDYDRFLSWRKLCRVVSW